MAMAETAATSNGAGSAETSGAAASQAPAPSMAQLRLVQDVTQESFAAGTVAMQRKVLESGHSHDVMRHLVNWRVRRYYQAWCEATPFKKDLRKMGVVTARRKALIERLGQPAEPHEVPVAKHTGVHEDNPLPVSASGSTDAAAHSASSRAQDAESAQHVAPEPPAPSPDSELDNVAAPAPSVAPAPSEVPTPGRLQTGTSLLDDMLRAAEEATLETANPASTLRTVDETALQEMGGELRPVLTSGALNSLQMSASAPELQFPAGHARIQQQVVAGEQYGELDVPNLERARGLAERATARWAHSLQLKAWYSWTEFAFDGPERAEDTDLGPEGSPPHPHWTSPRSMQERADILRQGASQSALTFYAGIYGETKDAQIDRLQLELEKLKLDMRKSSAHQAVQEDEILQLQQEVIEARRREAEAQTAQAENATRFHMLLRTLQDVEETLVCAANGARSQNALLRILRSIHCEKI